MKNKVNELLLEISFGYNKQLSFYQTMLKLSQDQEKLLDDSIEVETDSLIKLLNKRQNIINKVEKMSNDLLTKKQEVCSILELDEFSIRSIYDSIDCKGADDLEVTVKKLAKIIFDIKNLDKVNEIKLKKHIAKTKIKLADVQGKKKVNNAYNPKAIQKDGIFIDYSK